MTGAGTRSALSGREGADHPADKSDQGDGFLDCEFDAQALSKQDQCRRSHSRQTRRMLMNTAHDHARLKSGSIVPGHALFAFHSRCPFQGIDEAGTGRR